MSFIVIILISIIVGISMLLACENDGYPLWLTIVTIVSLFVFPYIVDNGYWVSGCSVVFFLIFKFLKKISDDAETEAVAEAVFRESERKEMLAEKNKYILSVILDEVTETDSWNLKDAESEALGICVRDNLEFNNDGVYYNVYAISITSNLKQCEEVASKLFNVLIAANDKGTLNVWHQKSNGENENILCIDHSKFVRNTKDFFRMKY